MQESKSPHNPRGVEVIRHRLRSRLHARVVVPAAVVLAGLSLAGVSAAVTGGGEAAPAAVALTTDQQARAEVAGRADRAQRSTASPSSGPTGAAPKVKAPAATTRKKSTKTKAPKATKTTKAPAWVNPMPGAAVTSCYGMRWGVLHAGMDLAADAGTPIHAVGSGTVAAAGWAYTGYGISVVIDHGNGYLTHYAHQSRVAVKVGQRVTAGQTIGYEGSTGDSTGPHLHFEVHKGLWNQVNPAPWLRAHGIHLGC